MLKFSEESYLILLFRNGKFKTKKIILKGLFGRGSFSLPNTYLHNIDDIWIMWTEEK